MRDRERFDPRADQRSADARTKAESAFRKVTAKRMADPGGKPIVPGAKEQVTLRIDQDVLEHFQADGPGWQDRINAAQRTAAGMV